MCAWGQAEAAFFAEHVIETSVCAETAVSEPLTPAHSLLIAHAGIQSHRLSQKYSIWQETAKKLNIWGFICWSHWILPAHKPYRKPKTKINGKAREGVNLQLLLAVKLYWRQVKVTQGFFTLNYGLYFILLNIALFFGFFHFPYWLCHSSTNAYVFYWI